MDNAEKWEDAALTKRQNWWIINILIQIRGLNCLLKNQKLELIDEFIWKKGFSEESMNLVTTQQKSKAWVIANTLPAKGEEFVCRTDGWIEKNTYGKKPKEYLDIFLLNGRTLVLGKILILSKQKQARNARLYLSRKSYAKVTTSRS